MMNMNYIYIIIIIIVVVVVIIIIIIRIMFLLDEYVLPKKALENLFIKGRFNLESE